MYVEEMTATLLFICKGILKCAFDLLFDKLLIK